MAANAKLLALHCVEAPFVAKQEQVKDLALEIFRNADFDVIELSSVFDHAGVQRRTLAAPPDSYLARLPLHARNNIFQKSAQQMLQQAAQEWLTPAIAQKISHVITISTSGISTPSIECALMQQLGINMQARRIPVFGLGCAGGIAGMQMARDLALADPQHLVLLLCVELTSLTFMPQDLSRRNFVACSLFGDGAAAALISQTSAEGKALLEFGNYTSELFPDTHDMMGWDVVEHGWKVIFSQRIPIFVYENVRRLISQLIEVKKLRHFAMHPGGQKVLDAYASALHLDKQDLKASSQTLAHFGNMSAASIFFVLREMLQNAKKNPGPGIMCTFGPGFTADLMRFVC